MYLISQGFIYLALALIIGGLIGYALRSCMYDNDNFGVKEELELARTRYEALLVGRTAPQTKAPPPNIPAMQVPVVEGQASDLSALSAHDFEGQLLNAAPGTPVKPRFGADDLTMIKGITPAVDAWLSRQGITRFAHIASLTPSELYWLVENLPQNGTSVYRDHWVAQATSLIARG